MTTLSNVGIPGVGTGVLIPKTKHHFRVLFSKPDGSSLGDWSIGLSLQTIAVSEICQQRGEHSGMVELTVEDDITNHACIALQNLFGEEFFNIDIEYLDGNGNESVVRAFKLKNCKVMSILHDRVDYAGTRNDKSFIEFKHPRPRSSIDISTLSEELRAALSVLMSSRLVFEKGIEAMKMEKIVSIEYNHLEIV